MRLLRSVLVVLALAMAAFVAVWVLAPVAPAGLLPTFDATAIGDDPAAYLAAREARFDDITPGVEKRIVWDGAPGEKTGVSVLYLHGFSATSEELRPVPDRVAARLGANLVYTRLAGHGRGGDALAGATVAQWMNDLAEALAVARRVGGRVLVIATSTGATLVAEAAMQPELLEGVEGVVFISPNFGINSKAAPLLTMPGARWILPWIVGEERAWEPVNEAQGKYWTTRYPVRALMPMARLVAHAGGLKVEEARVPALFYFSPRDRVVRGDLTAGIAARWGRANGVSALSMPLDAAAEVEPNYHVIAGDILSPGNTGAAVTAIVEWARGLR